MPQMISEIEDYFAKGCGRCDRFGSPECSTVLWRDGLLALREICQAAGLVETVKWGQPTYRHAGRNIVIIGALRGDFRLGFFEAGLMTDPEGILERQGPNTRVPDVIRFTQAAQVAARGAVISAYLQEAMRYAEEGLRAPKDTSEPDLPEELVEALDADAVLSEAWQALTPGRRKSYVINLNGAKQAKTRIARIARFRDKIIAGKGALDR